MIILDPSGWCAVSREQCCAQLYKWIVTLCFPSQSCLCLLRLSACLPPHPARPQSLFVLALLPVTTALYGIRLPDLPSYLAEGASCFRGLAPTCGSDCAGAPWLPIAYVVFNLGFNVAMLRLLRSVGAVTATIVGSCLVPLTIFAFTLPLPFLVRVRVLFQKLHVVYWRRAAAVASWRVCIIGWQDTTTVCSLSCCSTLPLLLLIAALCGSWQFHLSSHQYCR